MSPIQLAKYVWAWLVNEDDRVQRLGSCRLHFWGRRLVGPLTYSMKAVGVYWTKDLGQSPWFPQCPPFPAGGGHSSPFGKREYLGFGWCGDW